MTRTAAALIAVSLSACTAVAAERAPQTAAKTAPFALAPLPYRVDALEPAIDRQTMEIHHGRHHRAYLDNLNKAVTADPALKRLSLDQLVARAGTLSAVVRNNGGGHWNHQFFWASMAPTAASGSPSPALAAAITAKFGSLDAFKREFAAAGAARFGSGWVWLIVAADGELAITTTPNQDNPLMDVADVRGTPLLGNDVWEHAYYLRYQNRRADYLDAWWQVVNWSEVSRRYDAAK